MPKQKDGRYRAKVTVGHDADGEPVYRYASGKTKREMEINKAELRRHYVEGHEIVRLNILFGVYAQEWYETYKKPHIGESSRTIYRTMLNAHVLPVFEGRQLRAIRPAELQQFLNDHANMSKTSVRYLHSILRSIFQRATMDGIIARDPSMALTKTHAEPERRRALTGAETAAALHVANTHKDGLFLSVLYYTGMRRGEALGLRWSDVDFRERRIHVRRDIDYATNSEGALKSECSARAIPMPAELYEALNKARGIGGAYIFQSPETKTFLCSATYRRMWERLQIALLSADKTIEGSEAQSSKVRIEAVNQKNVERIKLKKEPVAIPEPAYGSVLTPHFFRHNYASLLYNAGVDVLTAQRYLGHKDARTTLTVYSHLSAAKEMESAARIDDVFSSQKVAEKLPEGDCAVLSKNNKSPKR